MPVSSAEIHSYLERLFPICRSITGNGNRQTLKILQEIVPLNVQEYASGTSVYDWHIPDEWNIKDAWIKNSKGEKIVDFAINNLHVVNYSTPIHSKIRLSELKPHLHFLPDQPELIPYKTSYYRANWGFCVSHECYAKHFNDEEEYEIFIDSDLKPGFLTLADYVLKGSPGKEYLFSTYFCHPSMANDNLSGVLVAIFLAKELSNRKLKNSYRFVFIPETIGAVTYSFMHEAEMKKIAGGLVFSCMAGKGGYGYKQTFLGNHLIDRAVKHTFRENNMDLIQYPFVPQGSDERQYSSPGFRIPVGSVHKDKYHEYNYYHTSGDDMDYVNCDYIAEMVRLHLEVIEKIEQDACFRSLAPYCEPQLGKRGLYPDMGRRTLATDNKGGSNLYKDELDILLWLLFYGDGQHSLLDIAEKHDFHFNQLLEITKRLEAKGLLEIIKNDSQAIKTDE